MKLGASGAFYLALKDLRLLFRDRIALFWVLGFPILFALFIGTVVRAGLSGDAGALRLIVVDETGSEAAKRVTTLLTRHERISVTHESLGEAERAVRHAQAVAYVNWRAGSEAGGAASVELGFDPAREMEATFLERLLNDALNQSNKAAPAVLEPVRAQVRKTSVAPAAVTPKRASDIVFPSAVLWGLIGCAACFAVSLVAERTRGTYVRLRALPVTRHTILAGKALSALAASLAVGVFLTLLGTLVFGVEVQSSFKLAAALTSTALCFVGITMALSVLGRSEQAVAGAGWATLLLMAMVGGAMVPLSLMPPWLTTLSHLSPVKWGILALEGATWRGFSGFELLGPCALLLAIGALSFLGGALLFSRSEA